MPNTGWTATKAEVKLRTDNGQPKVWHARENTWVTDFIVCFPANEFGVVETLCGFPVFDRLVNADNYLGKRVLTPR